MKNIFFIYILLFIFTGCDKHYDWHYKSYMSANAKNLSQQNVSLVFCSADHNLRSEYLQLPADQKKYSSDTYFKDEVHYSFDRRQIDSGILNYNFAYALLSTTDLYLNKLCVNSDAILDSATTQMLHRNIKLYLVINQADVCPTDFKDYDQSLSHCQTR